MRGFMYNLYEKHIIFTKCQVLTKECNFIEGKIKKCNLKFWILGITGFLRLKKTRSKSQQWCQRFLNKINSLQPCRCWVAVAVAALPVIIHNLHDVQLYASSGSLPSPLPSLLSILIPPCSSLFWQMDTSYFLFLSLLSFRPCNTHSSHYWRFYISSLLKIWYIGSL